MFLLKNYISRGTVARFKGSQQPRTSYFHGIPIEHLEVAKIVLANVFPNKKFRIRYRGKRVGYPDGRTRTQQYQDCLKAYATSFSVY
jgi:hypothetical protein